MLGICFVEKINMKEVIHRSLARIPDISGTTLDGYSLAAPTEGHRKPEPPGCWQALV